MNPWRKRILAVILGFSILFVGLVILVSVVAIVHEAIPHSWGVRAVAQAVKHFVAHHFIHHSK
jgi:hypothetical protein